MRLTDYNPEDSFAEKSSENSGMTFNFKDLLTNNYDDYFCTYNSGDKKEEQSENKNDLNVVVEMDSSISRKPFSQRRELK